MVVVPDRNIAPIGKMLAQPVVCPCSDFFRQWLKAALMVLATGKLY